MSTPRLATASDGTRVATRFRPDIEGLRSIAVLLVLIYHAGLTQLPGGFVGVDIFFVISGFLITSLLIREFERTGTVSIRDFYARRARRLLPAAALVLVVVSAMVAVAAPSTQRWAFGWDAVAASTFVVNWRFAERSVDYLAADIGPSPVLHFWSLSVEEQFYVIWPMLIVGLALLVRRFGWPGRPALAWGLALVVVPSFAWSVWQTANNPAHAFFETPTRLWELGIGAAVAVGAGLWVKLGARTAAAIGVAGLVALAASAALITEQTAWPGYAALLPTLGTAAAIIAGFAAPGPATRLLSVRPAVWIGGLSYSLYLWHWPMLVGATWYLGELSVPAGLAVVAASFVPAYLSLRLVENPVRFNKAIAADWRKAWAMGAALILVGVVAGGAAAMSGRGEQLPPPLEVAVPAAGAGIAPTAVQGVSVFTADADAAVDTDATPEGELRPPPLVATSDLPATYAQGCQIDFEQVEHPGCVVGDPEGGVRIVAAGDSKLMQWTSALDQIGQARGWRIEVYGKSSCAFTTAVPKKDDGGQPVPYPKCQEANEALLQDLLASPPDVVLTSNRLNTAYDAEGELTDQAGAAGMADAWRQLEAAGTDVVALLDNPSPLTDVPRYQCVADHLDDLSACDTPLSTAKADSGAMSALAAASIVPDVTVIDMGPAICPDDCPAVIDDVVVYRDGSHLTDTFVRVLTPELAEALDGAVAEALVAD